MTVKICGSGHKRSPSTVEVSNTSNSYGKGLSYSKVGPVYLNGLSIKNIDNALAASTAYEHFIDSESHSTEEYTTWLSRVSKLKNLSSFFVPEYRKLGWIVNGNLADTVTMRNELLIPIYMEAVCKTREWKLLQMQYDKAGYIELFDPAVRSPHRLFREAIADIDSEFSPVYILGMMLIYGTVFHKEVLL